MHFFFKCVAFSHYFSSASVNAFTYQTTCFIEFYLMSFVVDMVSICMSVHDMKAAKDTRVLKTRLPFIHSNLK